MDSHRVPLPLHHLCKKNMEKRTTYQRCFLSTTNSKVQELTLYWAFDRRLSEPGEWRQNNSPQTYLVANFVICNEVEVTVFCKSLVLFTLKEAFISEVGDYVTWTQLLLRLWIPFLIYVLPFKVRLWKKVAILFWENGFT